LCNKTPDFTLTVILTARHGQAGRNREATAAPRGFARAAQPDGATGGPGSLPVIQPEALIQCCVSAPRFPGP